MAVLQVLSNDEEMFTICSLKRRDCMADKDDVERSLNMLQARVSLLDLMNKYDGKIPEKDVNCYTQIMLEGLLGVHEKGFIHSDLQPDTRFGLQCTRYYMSPESIVEKVNGTLNKWSLGCIVVEMITGILPWDTHDRDDLTDKLLRGESPNIPKDMSKLEKSFLR
ncbi:hypothetical protein Goklo_014676 [Gossypium klotzschianum]|uniref:Protein kinase domain-containing protein n=1 Tax=Gossypium klotzschianum TaxID=34286 RepID=A0A7J8U8C9_9ROSI|nr:hypothetical protein [Gossypium klotzschianum]